jgi:uncharacterized OB-fold protein
MALEGEYLGMKLVLGDHDPENRDFFAWCGRHELRLQRWKSNGLMSYPPGTACPWDGTPEFEWEPIEGRGSVMSYSEVHHAIMPMFKEHLPYLLLRVELDTQRGQPTEHEAIRFLGNLVMPDGAFAPHEVVEQVGIGSRVRVVYVDVGEGLAIPQWTLDEAAAQPTPWRYNDGHAARPGGT